MTTPTRDLNLQRLILPLVGSLTLGLAPFTPEPHILGKLRWVAGEAKGMGLMDWGDLLMHGAPWIWLLVSMALVIRDLTVRPPPSTPVTG